MSENICYVCEKPLTEKEVSEQKVMDVKLCDKCRKAVGSFLQFMDKKIKEEQNGRK